MDPQACLFDLLAAIKEEDRDKAVELLESLAEWLDNGGFFPYIAINIPREEYVVGK